MELYYQVNDIYYSKTQNDLNLKRIILKEIKLKKITFNCS